MMKRHAAYCGLYCGACWSMIAYEQAQGESSALGVKLDANEPCCQGCDSAAQNTCEFVVCNKNHGTQSCAFCPEFPCVRITAFSHEEWEHHKVVLDNLNRIKDIGTEAWLLEQKVYWTCPSCHARTKWYQEQCTHCDTEIVNNI